MATKKRTKKAAKRKPAKKAAPRKTAKKKAVKKAAPKKAAKKKTSSKGNTIARITRRPGMLYFVDGTGAVKETKMNRKGGKRGRHVCSK